MWVALSTGTATKIHPPKSSRETGCEKLGGRATLRDWGALWPRALALRRDFPARVV